VGCCSITMTRSSVGACGFEFVKFVPYWDEEKINRKFLYCVKLRLVSAVHEYLL